MTKSRIAWGNFFTGDNVMWHQPVRPVGSIAVGCRCRYWALNDLMSFMHCSRDSQTFSMDRTAPKLPLVARRFRPPIWCMVPLGPTWV